MQLSKLIDAARTDILAVVNRKSATIGALEAVVAKYKEYPHVALADERTAVEQRVNDLRALKNRLCEVCSTCHPQDIQVELNRYADYGDAIADERTLLDTRLKELIQSAREELRRLIEGGDQHVTAKDDLTPVAQLMERALTRFKNYPQVADLYTSLRSRFETFTNVASKRLSRLYASDSIADIDAALTEYSQSGAGLAPLLLSLQRRRMQLCDDMAARLKACCQNSDPSDVIALLSAADCYGSDVDNERHLLEEHLRRLMDSARSEITAMMHSRNSREIEALLDKYSNYPPEIIDGPLAELEAQKEELRRSMIAQVETAMGRCAALQIYDCGVLRVT
eukprot:SAG31_NODE_1129_length_9755_cov_2.095070_11_plen_338_part_00